MNVARKWKKIQGLQISKKIWVVKLDKALFWPNPFLTREFFRKWGTVVQHNALMMPIITPKLNIGFVVKNCELNLLNHLEPWCSTIYVDCEFEDYIKYEQLNTTDNLSEKIYSIHSEKNNDILVRFDATQITNESFQYITKLANIITDDANFFTGKFEFDIFEVEIINKNTFEEDLIKCK